MVKIMEAVQRGSELRLELMALWCVIVFVFMEAGCDTVQDSIHSCSDLNSVHNFFLFPVNPCLRFLAALDEKINANMLKGQFTSKSKIHFIPLTCGAIYSSRLFWCELQSVGGIGRRAVGLLSNLMGKSDCGAQNAQNLQKRSTSTMQLEKAAGLLSLQSRCWPSGIPGQILLGRQTIDIYRPPWLVSYIW